MKRIVLDRIPLGRVGQPEDVVNAALFLASDESSWISGANIVVDGGGSVLGSARHPRPAVRECWFPPTGGA